MNRKIILASTSPRRKALLKQIGLSCTIVPSHYEEKMNPRLKPRGQAEFLSLEKAKAVYTNYMDQDVVILAADTLIDFLGETLGKPKDSDDAGRMLTRMNGTSHKVITAFTLIDGLSGKTVTKSKETIIHLKKNSQKDIEKYVATGEPLDRAGSFAIDGIGAILVETIEGDYANVVGLPISMLTDELKKFKISLFS